LAKYYSHSISSDIITDTNNRKTAHGARILGQYTDPMSDCISSTTAQDKLEKEQIKATGMTKDSRHSHMRSDRKDRIDIC